MTRDHRSTRPTGSGLLRILTSLALVGFLSACGGDPEPARDSSSTRTGGIFGGTPAPTSERESSPAPAPGQERAAPSSDADGPGAGARPGPEPPASPPGDSQRIDVSDLGYTTGSPDAPIQVIEFSDFGCGYCRKFHLETYPTLHEEYVETGKVAWKYIPFVLGQFPNGVEAALAGECAIAQGGFPAFRDRLFEDQGPWREAGEPLDVFVRLAREEGLDADRLRTCYEEGHPEERVRQNIRVGRQVGVRGTPTFLVAGHPLQGALPLEVFREIFDGILEDPAVSGNPTQGGEQ